MQNGKKINLMRGGCLERTEHPSHSWVFATDGRIYCPRCKTVMQRVQDAVFHVEQAGLKRAGFIRLGDKIQICPT